MRFTEKVLCWTVGLAVAFLLGGATVVCSVKHARAKRCRAEGSCAGDPAEEDPILSKEDAADGS